MTTFVAEGLFGKNCFKTKEDGMMWLEHIFRMYAHDAGWELTNENRDKFKKLFKFYTED